MIIDASALLSIVLDEDDAPQMIETLALDGRRTMSAMNMWEVWARTRRDPEATELAHAMHALLARFPIEIAPIGEREMEAAIEADRRYGRNFHKAKLNFGDCFAYALAKTRDEPLLFKGDDFIHTDVRSAL